MSLNPLYPVIVHLIYISWYHNEEIPKGKTCLSLHLFWESLRISEYQLSADFRKTLLLKPKNWLLGYEVVWTASYTGQSCLYSLQSSPVMAINYVIDTMRTKGVKCLSCLPGVFQLVWQRLFRTWPAWLHRLYSLKEGGAQPLVPILFVDMTTTKN